MTDYNDGKWHGWNGGDCPVHPLSKVEARLRAVGQGLDGETHNASRWSWKHGFLEPHLEIIAFRVVGAYREPLERWLCGRLAFNNRNDAEQYRSDRGWTDYSVIHVREVAEKTP